MKLKHTQLRGKTSYPSTEMVARFLQEDFKDLVLTTCLHKETEIHLLTVEEWQEVIAIMITNIYNAEDQQDEGGFEKW